MCLDGELGDGDKSLVELVPENFDLYEGLENGFKQFTVVRPCVLDSSAAASTRDLKFAFCKDGGARRQELCSLGCARQCGFLDQ